MSFVKQVLKFAAPMKKLEDYERFLFVGPHPDDIEIGAGATVAKLTAMGKEVAFCIVTDGRFGDIHMKPGTDRKEVAKVRREEALKSAAMLQVSEVHFLEFSDGGFYKMSDLEKSLAAIISDFCPDVILGPDPDVKSECHVDHKKAGKAASKLACFAPYGGIMEQYGVYPAPVKALAYYMTASPNTYVDTTGYLKKQLCAIFKVHKSQYPEGSKDAKDIQLYLKLRALQFGFRKCVMTGEAFRMYDQLHMHCLPEAGE